MMRGVKTWAVAVRKPAPEDAPAGTLGEIAVSTFPIKARKRRRLYRLPVIRGVFALVESLSIGLRALGISANAQLPEDEKASDASGGQARLQRLAAALGANGETGLVGAPLLGANGRGALSLAPSLQKPT